VAHDLVAPLRHPRHVFAPPFGVESESQEPGADLVADGLGLARMLVHFVAGLVNGLERRPGTLELPAGLEAGRAFGLGSADRRLALLPRLPAETGKSFEQRLDAVGALVRQAPERL